MEPIVTTLRLGLSAQTRPSPPEGERVARAGGSAAARDHGDDHPMFPVHGARGRHGDEVPADEALRVVPEAGRDEAPAGPLAPGRLAAALVAADEPALLRVASALAGDASIPLGGRTAVVLDPGEAGRDGRRGYARLLVALPTLGGLEIRIRIDPNGVAALVLAGSERALEACRGGSQDLARALVRATGLRGRADVAAAAPEQPAPPQPVGQNPFDAYA